MGNLALTGGEALRTKPFPVWPVFGKEEEQGLLDVLHSGKWWFGERVHEFEEKYAAFQNAKYGVTCTNGTVALELALKALGIGPGDEVLVPAYTFIATATAVSLIGAKPVFVDVNPDTVCMDISKAEPLISDKTRAIAVVHFAGLPADMDAVNALAAKYKLRVLEDAAHAWGSQWKGKGCGAVGEMGTFSFQMSKNITSAEGGIILSDNKDLADMARSLTNCGRAADSAWYEHRYIGGNNRMTEFQAALLLAQLGRLEEQTLLREKNAAILNEELPKIAGITVQPNDPRVTRRSYHLYCMRYNAEEFGGLPRLKFIEAMNAEGVPVSRGYLTPAYKNPCFQNMEGAPYKSTFCPAAEKLCSDEALWLTHNMLLGDGEDMLDIVNAIKKVQANQKELLAEPEGAACS